MRAIPRSRHAITSSRITPSGSGGDTEAFSSTDAAGIDRRRARPRRRRSDTLKTADGGGHLLMGLTNLSRNSDSMPLANRVHLSVGKDVCKYQIGCNKTP